MPTTRVYADTSVYGGAFDTEFAAASTRFFDEVRLGRFALTTSPLVEDELVRAPETVRALFESLRPTTEVVSIDASVVELQIAYLTAGIVSENSAEDALHVASATVAACGLLLSWNFKHIVHRDKAPRYNAVNTLRGLPTIGIYSPAEVVRYG
jgi:predicted nucleic acid-binding protein